MPWRRRRARGAGRRPAAPGAWLTTVARRRVIDRCGRGGRCARPLLIVDAQRRPSAAWPTPATSSTRRPAPRAACATRRCPEVARHSPSASSSASRRTTSPGCSSCRVDDGRPDHARQAQGRDGRHPFGVPDASSCSSASGRRAGRLPRLHRRLRTRHRPRPAAGRLGEAVRLVRVTLALRPASPPLPSPPPALPPRRHRADGDLVPARPGPLAGPRSPRPSRSSTSAAGSAAWLAPPRDPDRWDRSDHYAGSSTAWGWLAAGGAAEARPGGLDALTPRRDATAPRRGASSPRLGEDAGGRALTSRWSVANESTDHLPAGRPAPVEGGTPCAGPPRRVLYPRRGSAGEDARRRAWSSPTAATGGHATSVTPVVDDALTGHEPQAAARQHRREHGQPHRRRRGVVAAGVSNRPSSARPASRTTPPTADGSATTPASAARRPGPGRRGGATARWTPTIAVRCHR